MGTNNIKYSAMAVMSLFMLGSCGILNNSKSNSDTNKSVKKEAVLPLDRKALQVHSDPKTYSPEEFAKGIIKGDWAIDEVYGEKPQGQVAPFIKFSESEGRIYGNNGCNTINADYTYNAKDNTLKFSNTAVTMMLCPDAATEHLINTAVNETRSYSLRETEDGYLMTLYDGAGKKIMELTHQNLDFLNGTWKVVAIEGEAVNIPKMKLVFDIDEHKIHGNTGCNVLNGRLETEMDAPNTFSFEGIAVTMMMCPDIEHQTAMLVALEDACRAKPVDKNKVILLDASGKEVMTLERTTDK